MPKCVICKKQFASLSSLEDHHRSVHKGQRLVMPSNNAARKRIIAIVVVIVVILGGAGGYFVYQSINTPSSQTTVSSWVGREAPTFALPVVDSQNSVFNLSSYQGKSNVLLLFNGGLSCSSCLQQMVDMNDNYSRFKELNVVIVGITGDSSSGLSQWAKVNSIGPLMVISNQNLKVFNEYGMSSGMMTHTFVLIDTSGTIRWMQNYPSMFLQENQLISIVNSSLA